MCWCRQTLRDALTEQADEPSDFLCKQAVAAFLNNVTGALDSSASFWHNVLGGVQQRFGSVATSQLDGSQLFAFACAAHRLQHCIRYVVQETGVHLVALCESALDEVE